MYFVQLTFTGAKVREGYQKIIKLFNLSGPQL